MNTIQNTTRVEPVLTRNLRRFQAHVYIDLAVSALLGQNDYDASERRAHQAVFSPDGASLAAEDKPQYGAGI